MSRLRAAWFGGFGALLLLFAGDVQASVCLSNENPHACSSVESCQAALRRDPLDAAARLALCDLQVEQNNLQEAEQVLNTGLRLCRERRSGRLCRVLGEALSNVEERKGSGEKVVTIQDEDVWRGYCLGPIVNERAVDACGDLLARERDAEVYAALARKLLRLGRPARALVTVDRAAESVGSSPTLVAIRKDAEVARAQAARSCIEQLQMSACDAALLEGAPDTAAVLRARGQILQSSDPEAALESLGAAFELASDTDTARLILGLDERRFEKNDVGYRKLRSDAFKVLGDKEAELKELRVVVSLDPGASDYRARLGALVAAAVPPPPPPDQDRKANVEKPEGTPVVAVYSNRMLDNGRMH